MSHEYFSSLQPIAARRILFNAGPVPWPNPRTPKIGQCPISLSLKSQLPPRSASVPSTTVSHRSQDSHFPLTNAVTGTSTHDQIQLIAPTYSRTRLLTICNNNDRVFSKGVNKACYGFAVTNTRFASKSVNLQQLCLSYLRRTQNLHHAIFHFVFTTPVIVIHPAEQVHETLACPP